MFTEIVLCRLGVEVALKSQLLPPLDGIISDFCNIYFKNRPPKCVNLKTHSNTHILLIVPQYSSALFAYVAGAGTVKVAAKAASLYLTARNACFATPKSLFSIVNQLSNPS